MDCLVFEGLVFDCTCAAFSQTFPQRVFTSNMYGLGLEEHASAFRLCVGVP